MSGYIYGKTRDARILLSATPKQKRDLSKRILEQHKNNSSFFIKIGEREIKFSW